MGKLDGKVAIITGSSKGIGESIARGLAEMGAKVVLSSRKQEPLLFEDREKGRPTTENGKVAPPKRLSNRERRQRFDYLRIGG